MAGLTVRMRISFPNANAPLCLSMHKDMSAPPPTPPSMKDIARHAGVHQTTVSRALRNDPHLPAATRARIQALARELGYRPNPLVSALVALRRLRRKPAVESCLGFIVRALPLRPTCQRYLEGARAAAAKLGYRIEVFPAGDGPGSAWRLDRMLRTRGIPGILLGPLPEARGGFPLSWDHFAVVALEHTFVRPVFDRVAHDSYAGMRTIVEACRGRARWRVGLVLTDVGHERTLRSNAAALLVEQQADPRLEALPPLILEAWDPAAFARWQAVHAPNAIVTSNDLLPDLEAWHRWMAPFERPLLLNVNACAEGGHPGVVQAAAEIGALATRLLVDKLQRNERGVPALPQTVLIPGRWTEGSLAAEPAQSLPAGGSGAVSPSGAGAGFGSESRSSPPRIKMPRLATTNQSPLRT